VSPSKSEKTKRDSKGREGNQSSRVPPMSVPEGSALRSLGEKFAANPVIGTGSMTVPSPPAPVAAVSLCNWRSSTTLAPATARSGYRTGWIPYRGGAAMAVHIP
jgi:hypothetical protein